MVEQTNLYAQHLFAQNPGSFLAKSGGWTPVSAAEMRTFWGLVLHMGLVKKPSARLYWSGDILYQTPLYSNAMTRSRFEAIRKCCIMLKHRLLTSPRASAAMLPASGGGGGGDGQTCYPHPRGEP